MFLHLCEHVCMCVCACVATENRTPGTSATCRSRYGPSRPSSRQRWRVKITLTHAADTTSFTRVWRVGTWRTWYGFGSGRKSSSNACAPYKVTQYVSNYYPVRTGLGDKSHARGFEPYNGDTANRTNDNIIMSHRLLTRRSSRTAAVCNMYLYARGGGSRNYPGVGVIR